MNVNQIRQFLLDQAKSLIQFGNSESTNIDVNVVAFLLDNAVAEIKAKVKKEPYLKHGTLIALGYETLNEETITAITTAFSNQLIELGLNDSFRFEIKKFLPAHIMRTYDCLSATKIEGDQYFIILSESF